MNTLSTTKGNALSTDLFQASLETLWHDSPETWVHPTAIVGPHVQLGTGVKVGPYAVIVGTAIIGDHVRIGSHTVIGSIAQDTRVAKPLGTIYIGSHTSIRSFVTIDSPSVVDGATRIGSHCLLMHFAHIAHDATLEDHVVLTNHVLVAGFAYIEHHAVLMAQVAVHQRCRIGAYTALAPFGGTRQDLPPFCLFVNRPAHFAGLNLIALRRGGYSREEIFAIKHCTHLFYTLKLSLPEIEARLSTEGIVTLKPVQHFLNALKASTRGVSRKTITSSREAEE